ncbi:MAG: hypothetical protein AAGG48_03045 [Planctomycetota bacterium]
MQEGVAQLLFSPSVLLWVAISAVAVVILLGTVSRRRDGLTDTLKNYVDRNQAEAKAAAEAKTAKPKSSSE